MFKVQAQQGIKGVSVTKPLIGTRIKALRQARGISQDELARALGFKDRQIVSAIETGVRRVAAEELLLAMEHLAVPLDYFTDPYRLDGEGLFSWRQMGVPREQLMEYETTAGQWIGGYRVIASQVGRKPRLMRQALGLTKLSSFEEATEAGERFVAEFELGPVPGLRLAEVMEERLGILVLLVDAYDGISGAACRLPDLDTVLIARGEIRGRRNFDLAHELFHILTWDAMPPDHVEDAVDFSGNRVEQLANNFAAAVLMPRDSLAPLTDWASLDMETLCARLNATAENLHVSSSALRWRLAALGALTRKRARSVPEGALRNNGRAGRRGKVPALFSRGFAEVLAAGIDRGHISVRRTADLVGLPIEGLEELFEAHGVAQAIDL